MALSIFKIEQHAIYVSRSQRIISLVAVHDNVHKHVYLFTAPYVDLDCCIHRVHTSSIVDIYCTTVFKIYSGLRLSKH